MAVRVVVKKKLRLLKATGAAKRRGVHLRVDDGEMVMEGVEVGEEVLERSAEKP
jgi:hypothetical protein